MVVPIAPRAGYNIVRGLCRKQRLAVVNATVEQLARQHSAANEELVGTFYWPPDTPPGVEVSFRMPASGDAARGVEEVSLSELVSLARSALRAGKSGEEALVTMARDAGLSKLRSASRLRLEAALAAAAEGQDGGPSR